MALNYAKLFNRRITPQSHPIPGSTQVANSGDGYSWQVDDWTRFDRFLILGAEGGTYYIGERDLVKQNHDAIVRCIMTDGIRAVKRIVEISESGRAPKNDPAVFALALVAAHGGPARSTAKTVWQPMPRPASCRRSLKPSRRPRRLRDRKSTRLNSSHANISYAVFCLQ